MRRGYAVAKQAAQRYAVKISLCGRLKASISITTLQTFVKSDPGKKLIMLKNTKITSFKPDNVKIVHGVPELINDIGEKEITKFRPFTGPRDYFAEPFYSSDRNISVLGS
ncbi:unnamed protein product [Schistosoma mattheei]|uniref:Uncharacterized protein n=1 Tax=Schistosoma mattheei TaxID=31246 RepID=A0A183NU61_9TREM|nr:unnamed protein product [Schistosoma mattheei]